MLDGIIKWKINILYSVIKRMNNAKSNLDDLNANINELNKILGGNIKINDVVAYKEYPEDALSESKIVSSNITGKIVPSLYNSIKKLEEDIK